MKQIKETLGYYKQNAKVLAATLDEAGHLVHRRQEQPVPVAQVPERHGFLDLLRLPA